MATENGTILELSTPIVGVISRDNGLSPNPVKFNDPGITKRGVVLNVNDAVTYDIDSNAIVTNVNLASPSDPDYPSNSQYPNATIINTPLTQDVTVNGNVVIIDGAALTGNVKVSNGGTIIVKSSSAEGGTQASVSGNIHASENTTIIIYNSIIGGNLGVAGATTLKVVKGTTVKGNAELARTKNITVKGTTVKGNAELQKNQNITIKGTTVKGNVEIQGITVSTILTDVTSTDGNVEVQGNAGCSYTNVTAPKGKVNISGCSPA